MDEKSLPSRNRILLAGRIADADKLSHQNEGQTIYNIPLRKATHWY